MRCPNPGSPRTVFQWRYFLLADPVIRNGFPNVLNIGCASDPMEFGERALHFDLDDWSYLHKYFQQGDAHHLPFADQQFDTIILGDILEHVMDPRRVIEEACRVSQRWVVLTIFEEWKLPGPGRWVEEGALNGDLKSRELGYQDREDYQLQVYPQRVGHPDVAQPHLVHIWQFTDGHIRELFQDLPQFRVRESRKDYEATQDDHRWYNWLVCLERTEVPSATT